MYLLVFSYRCRRSAWRTLADGGLASSLSYVKGGGVCIFGVGFDEQDFNKVLKKYVKIIFPWMVVAEVFNSSIQKAETGRFL